MKYYKKFRRSSGIVCYFCCSLWEDKGIGRWSDRETDMMRLTVTFALVLQMVKYMFKFVIKVVLFPLKHKYW